MMVDRREGKGEYIQWRPDESKMLLELVASCFKQGFGANGKMFKKTVETKILSVINEKFNCRKTHKHYINRMKILKNQYRDFVNLLHFDPKFEWNPITKKFTAPNDLWDDYFREFPNQRHMRYETFEDYETMKLVFGNNMAMKRCERSHSLACAVGENEKPKQDVDLTNDDDESTEIQNGTSLHLENVVGKPLQNASGDSSDASVTEKDILVKICMELRSIGSINNQMLCILQGRSMGKEKKNNVWDAITEVPNLTNRARYDALAMIQKLGMRDVFISMSIEDRLGWIHYNTK